MMDVVKRALMEALVGHAITQVENNPKLQYDRIRARMWMVVMASIANKDVQWNQTDRVAYLTSKGFTLTEIRDLLPSVLLMMLEIAKECPDIFDLFKGRNLEA